MRSGAKFHWVVPCLILLFILSPVFADTSACPVCTDFANASHAHVMITVDENQNAQVVAYYDNATASNPRPPVNDAIIILEFTNSTGLGGPEWKYIYKTYTDANGEATFSFQQFASACVNIKALYCPFCASGQECGFSSV